MITASKVFKILVSVPQKCSNFTLKNCTNPVCVCLPGGGVWRARHLRDRRALPGLCDARPAQDVL